MFQSNYQLTIPMDINIMKKITVKQEARSHKVNQRVIYPIQILLVINGEEDSGRDLRSVIGDFVCYILTVPHMSSCKLLL